MTTDGLEIDELVVQVGETRVGPVHAEVAPGQVLVVAGPSGAGKTTLLRGICGLLPSISGEVRLHGRRLTDLPTEDRGLGYVPQSLALFPHRNAAANVRYPLEIRDREDAGPRAEALLQRFGIAHRAAAHPAQLSGGERQRVALARALAAEPTALLFDEPLSALDLLARDDMVELLRGVLERDSLPMVLVTHDPMTGFPLGDRFLFLEGGEARQVGSLSDVLQGPSTPFVARFLGFENVLTPGELGAAAGPFRRWLSSRSGPRGVAFPADALLLEPQGVDAGTAGPVDGGPWPARVRRWRVSSKGYRLNVEVEGIRLEAEVAREGGAPASPGRDVHILLREGAVCALGDR